MVVTKICFSCTPPTEKPIEDFYLRRASKDGRSNKCKSCESKVHQQYYRTKRVKIIHRKSKLKLNYGLTIKQFDKMFEEQGGACAICFRVGMKLVVDHDHVTNEVRQLLCSSCNNGLGQFKDNPEVVRSALSYLERHANKRVTS